MEDTISNHAQHHQSSFLPKSASSIPMPLLSIPPFMISSPWFRQLSPRSRQSVEAHCDSALVTKAATSQKEQLTLSASISFWIRRRSMQSSYYLAYEANQASESSSAQIVARQIEVTAQSNYPPATAKTEMRPRRHLKKKRGWRKQSGYLGTRISRVGKRLDMHPFRDQRYLHTKGTLSNRTFFFVLDYNLHDQTKVNGRVKIGCTLQQSIPWPSGVTMISRDGV